MKKYVFKPYEKVFPKLFLKEKERVVSYLKPVLAIEHVGSTAIPNLGGKGIIDIAIAVRKLDMRTFIKQLEELGYKFKPDYSTADRFYFIIYLPDTKEESRRYHVHLTYLESKDWQQLIGFRDYLRDNPDEVIKYAELKKNAAFRANQDGEIYRKLKEPMFEKINSFINKT